ncbi:MAG: DUF47 domain-containing protein [Candidatus Zixiibacteriota bacterium]|nr:MAG: DUF47 domain-containing protein [candidate division Zixibacteria bacterium]
MFQLFPKDRWFFETFAVAARNTHAAAKVFHDLLQDYSESRLQSAVQKIKEIEHEGDHLTHNVIDRLNKSFLTPYDREDIYQLIVRLDDVLDLMDGAASRVLHWKVGPPPMTLANQVKVLTLATNEIQILLESLQPHLVYPELRKHFEEVHRFENEGDSMQREALAHLFDNEKDPIRVIKLKEIHEFVENAIDKCEDVANVVEGICVKHA